MNRIRSALLICSIYVAALASGTVSAQSVETPAVEPKREIIFCADLMSHEEREAYRRRMASTTDAEQRAKLRASHQADMQARARQQGGEALCRQQGRGGQGPQYRGGR